MKHKYDPEKIFSKSSRKSVVRLKSIVLYRSVYRISWSDYAALNGIDERYNKSNVHLQSIVQRRVVEFWNFCSENRF